MHFRLPSSFSALFGLSLWFMTLPPALAQTIVPLWSGPAPESKGSGPDDTPTLAVYLPEKPAKSVPAVVICPGGGYVHLSMEFEGINIAQWFQSRGVAAFVLKYRLPAQGYRHPVPLLDAQRALRLVRGQAATWNVDPARIGIMGFSAGGHLAATLDTHFDAGNPAATDPADRISCRPDFAILVYPVITMKDEFTHMGSKQNLLGPNPDPALVENLSNETQVTADTPPTLLVDVLDDKTVPVENSRRMFTALQKAGVPTELQEYPVGGHGFGLGHVPDKSPKDWMEKVFGWLQSRGIAPGG
jgi:acetyl esterase/lipase